MKGPRLPRWLYPGMHLKRWLLVLFFGITVLGLGAAIFIVDWYRRLPDDSFILLLTGAGLDRPVRAVLVAMGGILLTSVITLAGVVTSSRGAAVTRASTTSSSQSTPAQFRGS